MFVILYCMMFLASKIILKCCDSIKYIMISGCFSEKGDGQEKQKREELITLARSF